MSQQKRKPLSFDTTLRNPERIAGFLNALAEFKNIVLDDEVIEKICIKIICKKLYCVKTAMQQNIRWKEIYKATDKTFSVTQAKEIMEAAPQNHKEAGFKKGWQSRFSTWFKFMMELGLCYFEVGKKIEISQTGEILIKAYNDVPINDNMIRNVFLNAMSKFQLSTPLRRNLNNNVPLLLLLRVIKLLRDNCGNNCSGIFRKEISIFLCWPNNDAQSLYEFIMRIRRQEHFNYSDEFIYEECLKLFFDETHQDIESLSNYIKMSKLMVETTDEYIRKMRITGVISLRGNGRFLDYNELERDKINYLLGHYGNCYECDDAHKFYLYMQTIDDALFNQDVETQIDFLTIKQAALHKYAELYSDEKLSNELKLTHSGKSKDELLKFIDAPARLEFLTSIALTKYFNNIEVIPNYPVDDEGLPKFTAGGGIADIECHNDGCYGLIEVTLMTGAAQQTEHEVASISDHLQSVSEESKEFTMSVFVAPIFTRRAIQYMMFLNQKILTDKNCAGIVTIPIDSIVPKFKQATNLRELAT